jgi:hypothetical protein
MNKKKGLLSIAASLLIIKMLPVVSALSSYDISQGPRDLMSIVSNFLSPFFEVILNTSAYDDFFFAKILLLILLFVVIVFILNKAKMFGDLTSHAGVIYTIAAAVSILSMRYLPESDLVTGILLPYSALGIAITTFLPLIIYFFFIHNSGFEGFGRRAGWALYGIVFLALWLSKDVQLSDTSNWIYWGALIFVGLSLIFDKSIHQYFAYQEIGTYKRQTDVTHINRLKLRLHELKQYPNWQSDNTLKKEIEDTEKALKKAITRM